MSISEPLANVKLPDNFFDVKYESLERLRKELKAMEDITPLYGKIIKS